MTLIQYFKEITPAWKVIGFLIVFCLWPLSAFLIFKHNLTLFVSLDIIKLTLLSSAITVPFLAVNTGFSFLLTNPSNSDIPAVKGDALISGTVLLGVFATMMILSLGALLSLFDVSYFSLIRTMAGVEIFFIAYIIFSAIKERR